MKCPECTKVNFRGVPYHCYEYPMDDWVCSFDCYICKKGIVTQADLDKQRKVLSEKWDNSLPGIVARVCELEGFIRM